VRHCCIPSLAQQWKQMPPHNNENKTVTMKQAFPKKNCDQERVECWTEDSVVRDSLQVRRAAAQGGQVTSGEGVLGGLLREQSTTDYVADLVERLHDIHHLWAWVRIPLLTPVVTNSQVLFHNGSLLHSKFNTQLLIAVRNSSRILTHVQLLPVL
jgi:hypothetical protein